MSAARKAGRPLRIAATAGIILALAAGATAQAQHMTTNSSSFNAGYGRTAGEENGAYDFSIRDANGNLTIIDGLMSGGRDQSTLSSSSIGGDARYSGVGGSLSAASAIGNNLTVVTSGSYNTVIVNSTQTNNGAVTANGTVNTQVAGAN
jgi:holdfast attachment protein HfaA